MRLIVGLGNPGREYEATPHNLGFLAIDSIAAKAGIKVKRPQSKSYVGRGEIAGQEVALAKPQTMMNLSGMAVDELLEWCECDAAEMIVLYDDVALPWGMLRIRERGSAGGHNGMKSVIAAVGSEFLRVRMGVQPDHPIGDLAAYVLRPMNRDQREIAAQMAAEATDAVELILSEGVDKAMLKYNRRVAQPAEE
ncbi:MAG TPA: aminoacyl-tRNA hydrolase [Candidatus Acidoferrales bacterium]|nr:aminoacyl-tRNA hydrolase [Candidatus Acidoferrales bacterium]